MDVNINQVVFVEVFLCWENEECGVVFLDVFILIVECLKLIQKLGDFVIDMVCQDFDEIMLYMVLINLLFFQFNVVNICYYYVDKLMDVGFKLNQIEIELIEVVLVEDFECVWECLVFFLEVGFKFNLDDFGIGFVGMGYLYQILFNKIKIDKSFVWLIGKGDGFNKMFQVMFLLGDVFKKDFVVEGVEIESQVLMFKFFGFCFMQGWNFG